MFLLVETLSIQPIETLRTSSSIQLALLLSLNSSLRWLLSLPGSLGSAALWTICTCNPLGWRGPEEGPRRPHRQRPPLEHSWCPFRWPLESTRDSVDWPTGTDYSCRERVYKACSKRGHDKPRSYRACCSLLTQPCLNVALYCPINRPARQFSHLMQACFCYFWNQLN